MSVAKTMTVCPFCKEPIAVGATKCKHCQSDLTAAAKKKKSIFAKYNTFRFGFLTGILFTITLGILVYMQFFRK
jgi:ribosomal protein L37AE/L43A